MENLVNMSERYNQYLNNIKDTWLHRFTWNGLNNDLPQNSISIVNFIKETDIFSNVKFPNNAKGFFNLIKKTVVNKYIDWCLTKNNYNEDEQENLRKFFLGCMGEYFFYVFLKEVKTILIKNENTQYLEQYFFNNVCPRFTNDMDYGVDFTGTVDHNNDSYNVVFQVKFWDPEYNPRKFSYDTASNVFTDAILSNYIDLKHANIFVCWLSDINKVSKYLKDYKLLYQRIKFIDKDVLDKTINNKLPTFWNILHNELINIKNF